jgi:hypothetical protein
MCPQETEFDKKKVSAYNKAMAKPCALLCLFPSLGLLFFGCTQKPEIAALQRENRFTLHYGSFEDELNLFDLTGTGSINTHLTMRDGIFYLSNGESKKVLRFNSYGNLLALYYNPDTNPEPPFASKPLEEDAQLVSTQTAAPYPFNNPGVAAVDFQKNLYVVDQLPPERQQRDETRQLLLAQVVLRFSNNGDFLDYVGQGGLGGQPFPYIKDISITKNNELVVVCQTRTGMLAYWYSPAGFLLYTIPINLMDLPNPVERETGTEAYLSLNKVIPDYSEKKLYLAIDYYKSLIDQASSVQYGIEYDRTLLYTLEVEKAVYVEPVLIPPLEQTIEENGQAVLSRSAYDFLGQSESRWFFFIIPDETGYMLQMVQQNGQRIQKRHLDVDSNTLAYSYYSFSLSPEGIISALLAGEESASVVWWRSDILLGNLQ